MSGQHLPWESLETPIYYPKELKPRKKWVYTGGWILSAALILGGIITPYRILLLFAILYILTLLMEKDVAVTERGLEIYYQMKITTHYDFWQWKEIDSLLLEDRNQPGLLALHFVRGNRSKRFFFSKADAKQIQVLARKKNSRIRTADVKAKNGNIKKR